MNIDDTMQAFVCCVRVPPNCAACPQLGPVPAKQPGAGDTCRQEVKDSVYHWLEYVKEVYDRGGNEEKASKQRSNGPDGRLTARRPAEDTATQDHSAVYEDGGRRRVFQHDGSSAGNHDRNTICRAGNGRHGAFVKNNIPAELEGGGWSWWFVCGKCHGTIDYKVEECPHCHNLIDWTGI